MGKFISNLRYQLVVFLQDISGLRSSQRRSDPFAKCGGHFWTNWLLTFMFAKVSVPPSPTKFENTQWRKVKQMQPAVWLCIFWGLLDQLGAADIYLRTNLVSYISLSVYLSPTMSSKLILSPIGLINFIFLKLEWLKMEREKSKKIII